MPSYDEIYNKLIAEGIAPSVAANEATTQVNASGGTVVAAGAGPETVAPKPTPVVETPPPAAPTPQKWSTSLPPPPEKPLDLKYGRRLGPTEYAQIVRENKVSSSNFDKYFWKVPQENEPDRIFLRPDAPLRSATAVTTPVKETNISVSEGIASPLPSGSGQTSSSATSLVAETSISGKLAEIDQMTKELNARRAEIEASSKARFDEYERRLKENMGTLATTNYEQFLRTEREREGIVGKENLLSDIQREMADVNLGLKNALIAATQRPIPLSFVRGMQARIQEQGAATAAALAARADIVVGQLDRAEKRIDTYFTAKKLDTENQINRFNLLLDLEEKRLVRLDDQEKASLQFMLDERKTVLDSIETEKSKILQLATQYPDAFAEAKVDFNMPADEIFSRVGAARVLVERRKAAQEFAYNLMLKYPDAGITLQDSLESARQKIVTRSQIYQMEQKKYDGSGSKPVVFDSVAAKSHLQSTVNALNTGAVQWEDVPDVDKGLIKISIDKVFGTPTYSAVTLTQKQLEAYAVKLNELASKVPEEQVGNDYDAFVKAAIEQYGDTPENRIEISNELQKRGLSKEAADQIAGVTQTSGPTSSPGLSAPNLSYIGGLRSVAESPLARTVIASQPVANVASSAFGIGNILSKGYDAVKKMLGR